jgi:beta-mannosidase
MHTIISTIDSPWQFAERLPAERDFNLPQGGEKLWLPAQVPGHVHMDMERNGVIGDPFYRMNERGCAWVDETDWTYRTTFVVDAKRFAARGVQGKHFLHFHGLDTICRVFLNGIRIGATENFFIPYRFDVTEAIREGDNELRVEFDSALRIGLKRAEAYLGDGTSTRGKMAYFNFGPRAFVRKPQYMFGWDWGPELISCGIWQRVELETIPVAEITDWRWDHRPTDNDEIEITVSAEIQQYAPTTGLIFRADLFPWNWYVWADNIKRTVEGQIPVEDKPNQRITLRFTLPASAVREWNVGVPDVQDDASPSEQPLYRLTFSLEQSPNANADNIKIKPYLYKTHHVVGFRKIELIREPDSDGKGEGMLFRINGKDTFMKGANWIPDHCFPASISPKTLRHRLEQARDAGFNMLRVWGGGYYETEEFYSLCNRFGILVWQDFPFACSSYPDDLPEFCEQIRQEAIIAVRRLRHQPCLALWCGGNENLELFQGRWNGALQATEFFGDRLIHEVLPEVLAKEDATTPYLPNSPYGDAGEGNSQNENYGDSHYWNVWHAKTPESTGDWTNYALSKTRFSSEFGFAAPASPAAWDSCMAPEDKRIDSPVFHWHDKTRKGADKYLAYIRMHYPDPQTFEDLIYYGQCNQADALQFGVEHWRRLKGRCWGTLFWQLNDCWPTHSWAVVDSLGEPKAAYYATKRFYAPLLLSLFREGETVSAHLVNDTLESVPGILTLRLLTFDGEELSRTEMEATAPANAASGAILTMDASDSRDAFIHAAFHVGGALMAENFQLLAEPKDIRLPDPAFSFSVNSTRPLKTGTAEITISAARFARYVWLQCEDVEGQPRFTDNFFHLAPGQTRTITVTNLRTDMTAEALKARLRLRWR